jgi:UDP-N-acetylglucosamine 4,6-dehydratase
MQQKFPKTKYPFIRYFIGDIRDLPRLTMAMRGVTHVVHAAALKHVPIAEYNPFEAVATNIVGTENVVRACLAVGVQTAVLLSTDKAASPTNLYGATKLAAERIFVAANALGPTKFSVARYGNVLGSRGSVVPYFKKLLVEGVTSLPITHPDMTRFWITLPAACDFVDGVLERAQGGGVVVPRLIAARMVDLADALAPGIATHVVGLRPGEKIHETLITADESPFVDEYEDAFVIAPNFPDIIAYQRNENAAPVGFSYRSSDACLPADAVRIYLGTAGLL